MVLPMSTASAPVSIAKQTSPEIKSACAGADKSSADAILSLSKISLVKLLRHVR